MPRTRRRGHARQSGARKTADRPGFPIAEATLTGQVLIAMPAMLDPRFAQSVIYMCAHTAEGAMGIVVNRPLVSAELRRPAAPARRRRRCRRRGSIRLCAGGPVDNAPRFRAAHRDWTGEGSLRVDDGWR